MDIALNLLILIFFIYMAVSLFKRIKNTFKKFFKKASAAVGSETPKAVVSAVSENARGVTSSTVGAQKEKAPSDAPFAPEFDYDYADAFGEAAEFDGEFAAAGEFASAVGEPAVNNEKFSVADEPDVVNAVSDPKPKRKRKDPLFIEFLNIVRIPFITVLFELTYWLLVDLFRALKSGKNKEVHIYGIWCFVGIYGGGKTMSLVRYLETMREKHGDKIYIATNFFYKNQDFPIKTWHDLLKDYDKTVIFGYDELQNEFNSRKYRDFPMPLMGLLTQNRKGRGKQIVFTAQNYGAVDKNFRDLCTKVVNCKTHAGRFTVNSFYEKEYYDQLRNTTSVDRKIKIRPKREFFIQTDYLRSLYDTRLQLDSARNVQYIGLDEMRKLRLGEQ